jgi:hypothetical protein
MPTYGEPDLSWFRTTRTAAIMELRLGFKMHGYDVDAYPDDQVSGAIVAEATADTYSSRDLFTRAFERLRQR